MWAVRGTSLLAAPVLVAVELVALFSRGADWRGEWAWTLDWANGGTILCGPILAGIVAFDVQRLSRQQSISFMRGLRRGKLVTIHAATSAWLVASIIHLLAVTFAITLTAITRPSGSIPVYMLLFGPLVLAAFATIGLVTGVFIPRMIGAPIALIIAFALTVAGANGSIPAVLRVGGVTGSLVGMQYDGHVLTVTAIFLTCAAVVLGCLSSLRYSPVSSAGWVATGVAAALISVLTLGDLQLNGDQWFTIADKPPALLCAGSKPQVCMARGTTRQLVPLAQEMSRQAQPLIAAGLELPAVYVQDIPGWRPPLSSGVVTLEMSDINAPRPNRMAVADYLATPAACPDFFNASGTPPEKAFAAKAVLADLIRRKAGLPFAGSYTDVEKAWLQSRAAQEWMISAYNSLKDCDLHAVIQPF
jgi:hypothetical protein